MFIQQKGKISNIFKNLKILNKVPENVMYKNAIGTLFPPRPTISMRTTL